MIITLLSESDHLTWPDVAGIGIGAIAICVFVWILCKYL